MSLLYDFEEGTNEAIAKSKANLIFNSTSSDRSAAKRSGFLRQEGLDLKLAGFRSAHRRWFSVSECERVGDQRERSPAAVPVLALLALGTLTSSV